MPDHFPPIYVTTPSSHVDAAEFDRYICKFPLCSVRSSDLDDRVGLLVNAGCQTGVQCNIKTT